MTDQKDMATAIAIEMAKQIPVKAAYEDIIKPAAEQTGALADDIAKTIRLVLAPLQFTAALQDRFRGFLDRAVRRIEVEDRVSPPPQILGPVLEGIRYEPENGPISEMFSHLLSASMDRSNVENAHPAFALIIKQLSEDEALVLNAMWTLWKQEKRSFQQQFLSDYDWRTNTFSNQRVEVDDMPRSELRFPANFEFYGQHLFALGITAFFDSAPQQPTFNGEKKQNGIRMFKELRFTDVGHKFMKAVSNANE